MTTPTSVQDYMAANLVTLRPDMDIVEAMRLLVERRISGAPVVDLQGNLVGVLSEQDCLKLALEAGYHEQWGGRVSETMSGEVRTVESESSILDAARLFVEGHYRRFPVVKDGRLVGQLSRRDVLRALLALAQSRG
ncbi:MAG: CBS domain-containing protein [Chromatiaceae bacterium]